MPKAKMRAMSTIRDVAQKAGVAISTVSAVINRSAPTSAAVVARVEQAIAEIGYAPQRAAQTLRSGRSRFIGLIVPDITNPHFSTLARIVENECLRAGYMTFLYNTDENADHEMHILKMMRMQRVAGLILISTCSGSEHGRRLMGEIDVPTVLMGSQVSDTPFDLVSLDDVKAGRLAAKRLIDLGHRRIAVIGGREGVSSHEERLRGCRLEFAERNLELDDESVVLAQFRADRAYEGTLRLLGAKPRPTAIITLSNFMTIGALRAFARSRVACPDDVSIVGVDDLDWADIMSPRPTLIAQPIAEMTVKAVSILLEQVRIRNAPKGQRWYFEPKLISRESCGPI